MLYEETLEDVGRPFVVAYLKRSLTAWVGFQNDEYDEDEKQYYRDKIESLKHILKIEMSSDDYLDFIKSIGESDEAHEKYIKELRKKQEHNDVA